MNRQVYVGLDIGGTKIGVNAVDADRKPVTPKWVEVEARSHVGPRATVEQIVVGLRKFLDHAGLAMDAVAGVGLDSPGPADRNGRIEKSANMAPEWEGFQLREAAQSAVTVAAGRELHVSYENDVNAAALWESFVGCPQGTEVMAMLAPGTGLGGGIVIDGRLLRGARGMAGELGHLEVVHRPFVEGFEPQCGCGQTYCTEAYVSLAALKRLLPVAMAQPRYKDHPLWKLTVPDGEDVWRRRAFEVRGLAGRGDELCRSIFEWQAEAVGKLCRQVSNTIDPHRIVIGGGFIEGTAELTERVMNIIRATFRKLGFKKHAEEVVIETAKWADQAGCLGAALSAWEYANER